MPSPVSEAIVSAILQRIAEERKSAGLSQERLAELSGVDLGVVSRAEHLLRIPSMAAILDLAQALDLDFPQMLANATKDATKQLGK